MRHRRPTLPSTMLLLSLATAGLGCGAPPKAPEAEPGDDGGSDEVGGDEASGDGASGDGGSGSGDGGDGGSGDDGVRDADADGVATELDCDDTDASLGARAEDNDCDAILTADDCDDVDPVSTARAEDNDCDTILTADDCDDADPASTARAEDNDCDAILTADDCDDADPASAARAEDNDCDGVLTADDCDDADASRLARADDGDCDGALRAADCDDADPARGHLAEAGLHLSPTGMRLVELCAHSLEVGCTPGQRSCAADELPVMPVTLSHAFLIGETEVSQAEYLALMGVNPSGYAFCGLDCPVDSLDWSDAAAFANALSRAEGFTECYRCASSTFPYSCSIDVDPTACDGYRLPTEAEWEAAARCGEDHRYAGSDVLDEVAWYWPRSSSPYGPAPVASLAPNACGLYDLTGNVWEWAHDLYSPTAYDAAGRTDPAGPSTDISGHTLRGNAWTSGPSGSPRTLDVARRSDRASLGYFTIHDTLGLRVARTLP